MGKHIYKTFHCQDQYHSPKKYSKSIIFSVKEIANTECVHVYDREGKRERERESKTQIAMMMT